MHPPFFSFAMSVSMSQIPSAALGCASLINLLHWILFTIPRDGPHISEIPAGAHPSSSPTLLSLDAPQTAEGDGQGDGRGDAPRKRPSRIGGLRRRDIVLRPELKPKKTNKWLI